MRVIKNLFLLSFLTVFACEGSYDLNLFSGGGDDCKISIEPPEWIRGNWHNNDNDNFIREFIFTKNDAKKITGGSSGAISLGYDIEGSINCKWSESMTETTYKLEIGTRPYEFTKIDYNTIEYYDSYYIKK
jgi:hypothetical protein